MEIIHKQIMFRNKFDTSQTESTFDKSHAEPMGGKIL